jgi:hypothetical protein
MNVTGMRIYISECASSKEGLGMLPADRYEELYTTAHTAVSFHAPTRTFTIRRAGRTGPLTAYSCLGSLEPSAPVLRGDLLHQAFRLDEAIASGYLPGYQPRLEEHCVPLFAEKAPILSAGYDQLHLYESVPLLFGEPIERLSAPLERIALLGNTPTPPDHTRDTLILLGTILAMSAFYSFCMCPRRPH